MFTVQKKRVPRLLMRNMGAAGTVESDLDRTQWPFARGADIPEQPIQIENSSDSAEALKEKMKQQKALGPLRQYLSKDAINELNARVVAVLELAKKTRTNIVVDGIEITILQILADAMDTGFSGWSVVGYDRVDAIKEFAQKELTLTKLKQI